MFPNAKRIVALRRTAAAARLPPRFALVRGYRTTKLPPPGLAPNRCSVVRGGDAVVQLLENHNPPSLFQTVIPMVSGAVADPPPGSPLSVMATYRLAFPSMAIGFSGSVISLMFAFPLKVAQ